MEKAIGPETKLKAEIVDGKIRFSTEYAGHDLDAGIYVASSVEQLIAALAELIPGDSNAEKFGLGLLETGLKAVVV